LRSELSDEELVAKFQAGDGDSLEILVGRYRRFTRAKSKAYFLIGADAQDVEQEGLIGLFKAARDYRFDRQSCFRAFADLCITRQIVTAIKTATRHKHRPLNQYVSVSQTTSEHETAEGLADKLLGADQGLGPAEHAASSERMAEMHTSMAELLTDLEADVLRLHVEGNSYEEISERLGRHVKSIDNSLQRIKRKLRPHVQNLAEEELAGV
jgi:RNA polymerase sporulation-specific sigma factor